MKNLFRLLLVCSFILGLISLSILILGNNRGDIGPYIIAALVCFAIGGMNNSKLKQTTFISWTFAVVALGMFYPQYFQKAGDFKLNTLVVPLLQIIMFSMGTEMSLKDFEGVVKHQKQ